MGESILFRKFYVTIGFFWYNDCEPAFKNTERLRKYSLDEMPFYVVDYGNTMELVNLPENLTGY